MFQYEDLDFETLCNSEEIDPDSPEALYAMAQFCRTGKGVEPSQEMYEKYLRSAAQAGSEAAARELEQLTKAPAAPRTTQAPSGLTELIRSAEKGQPESLIPAADACTRMGELERAVRFLQKAADLIDRNLYTEEECQQIWLKLARLWGSKELNDPEKCHRAYGMAAELHNAEAAAAYAEQCRNGYGCEKDEEKALHYEAISAERGGPMEKYGFALQLMTTGKRMDAAMLMEQAMNTAQDPETKQACRLLMAYLGAAPLTPETAQWAWQHYDGQKIQVNPVEDGKREDLGIPLLALAEPYGTMEHAREAGLPFDARQAGLIGKNTDPAVGIEWMEYAADQGDTSIYNALGYHYVVGKGVPKDPRRAFSWFEKGAEAGDATAQYNLGISYRDGNGVAADPEKMIYWFRQAADQGNTDAQYSLGVCCQDGDGVSADLEQAFYWFSQAAEQGHSNAQSNLGKCYQDGKGVAADPQKAAEWFRKAAEQGVAEAQYNLGNCYYSGDGVEKDFAQAAEWFQKAAEQGVAEAQYNLGICYRDGKGVPADTDKALYWLGKAADQGDEDARNAIEEMHRLSASASAGKKAPKSGAASRAGEAGNKWKVPLPLLIVVIAAVIWMVSGFAEVLFPAKNDAPVNTSAAASTAGTAGTGTSQASDPNVIDPFDPSFFNTPDGVELKFSGISPDGTLIISNNLPSDNPASQIIYEADTYEEIADQQNITITATLDSDVYRLKTKTLVIKAEVNNHYITSLDELNADSWAKIKTALDEVVLAKIGTPDESGIFVPNGNRVIETEDYHSLRYSQMYGLSYTSCVLLHAKNPEDLGWKEPESRLMIEYTIGYDLVPYHGDSVTETVPAATGCIYVDNLIVDGDGNAEVDSSQFSIAQQVYSQQVDFENDWIAPYMTTYSMSTVDASQVLPQ